MLFNGSDGADVTLVLAHGANAPMDSPFLNFFAEALAERGYRVARFECRHQAVARRSGSGSAGGAILMRGARSTSAPTARRVSDSSAACPRGRVDRRQRVQPLARPCDSGSLAISLIASRS